MEMPTKISDWLSREEIAQFTQRSDWHAGRVLLLNWAMIAATFWMVSVWTNPVTIIVAVILLGGRQMGLAGLMHEAGHKTFFKTQALNRWLGQWLCAYPILGDCDAYGASHREHHKMAGTDADPDLPNYRSYPVSKASFRRKVIRDLTGQTGIRNLRGIFFGRSRNMMMRDGEHYPAGKGLLANLVLLGVLVAFGVGELYLLWMLAYITTYSLVARLRQVAEHGAVAGLFDPDPRRHTRTILATAGVFADLPQPPQLPRRASFCRQRAGLSLEGLSPQAGSEGFLRSTSANPDQGLLGSAQAGGSGI